MEGQNGGKRTRKRKAREKKARRLHGRYFFCIAGLILVIAASFLAPTAVYAIQDQYQASRVELGARDVLELARFNSEYERELGVRLQNFAAQLAAGKEFYAVATDFEQDKITLDEVLEVLTASDYWVEASYEATSGTISWRFISDAELISCKQYVIFSGDLDAGIALSCLYVELYSEYYGNVYALYDLEDHTIYYFKAEVNAKVVEVWDYLKYEVSYETFYDNWDFPYQMAYNYGYYYQSSEVDDKEDSNIIINIYDASIYDREVRFSRLLKWNHVSYSVELPFQEEILHIMMNLQHDEEEFETVSAVVGIREIGDLIPEFNRD